MRNNFLYCVLLVFFGIDISASTGKTLIDEHKREYNFSKDPNSIFAANNIYVAAIGCDVSFKNFVWMQEKPKRDGSFYIKQATFQAYACDYSILSTIDVYRYKQGVYKHIKTQRISGIETFHRCEKLALEVKAFYDGQPSIKTE
ncbi:MAG: hypothetical protein ACXWL5_00715 [Candidatus Chromulinivorax sp.]